MNYYKIITTIKNISVLSKVPKKKILHIHIYIYISIRTIDIQNNNNNNNNKRRFINDANKPKAPKPIKLHCDFRGLRNEMVNLCRKNDAA